MSNNEKLEHVVNLLRSQAQRTTEVADKISEILRDTNMQIATSSAVFPSIVAPTEPVTRFTVTSPDAGSTLAVGDTVSWTDSGTLTNPDDKVDLALIDLDGVRYDQGPSTASGSKDLINVPAGDLTIELKVILTGSGGEFLGEGEIELFTGYQGSDKRISRAGFTSIPLGPTVSRPNFSSANWDSIWGAANMSTWYTANPQYISVKTVADALALEIEHVPRAGTAGGTERVNTGAYFDSGYETDVTIVQDTYLPSGFDYGTNSVATIKAALGLRSLVDSSGGLPDYEGCSSRFEVRREAGKEYYGIYLYTGDTTGYGDDEISDVEVIYDQHVELAMRVKMNSAYNVSDGILQFWVAGQLKINRSNMNWIKTKHSADPSVPSLRGLAFNSFHGGSDTSFNPAANQYPAHGNWAYKAA